MIKIIGSVMIVISCTLIGFCYSNGKKKRIEYIGALIYLIRHTDFKITYFRSEIKVIYDDFSNEFLEKCGFLDELRTNGANKALEKYNDVYSVRDYESNALMNFSQSLGKSSWEDQVNMCRALIGILEKYLDELNEKYPEERKLFSSLGIIAGLLVAVVLV